MEIEGKQCLECGIEIKGRVDKKFCSDLCRNAYHNRLNSEVNNHIRNVNNVLKKNRRILDKLNPEGKAKVSEAQLKKKGFNFNYYTNTFTTGKGNTYYFCYDLGYLPLPENRYFLVRKQEYVD